MQFQAFLHPSDSRSVQRTSSTYQSRIAVYESSGFGRDPKVSRAFVLPAISQSIGRIKCFAT